MLRRARATTTHLASAVVATRLASAIVATALAVGVVATAQPAWAAPTVVNVSRRHTNQSEAAVAVDPSDPQHVAIATNRESGAGLFVAVSHDGGATWVRRLLGDDDRFGRACCDPSIAWDPNGNLFLSWLGYTRRSYPTVVTVVRSTDAGDTWAPLARINPPNPDTSRLPLAVRDDEDARGPGFVDQPTIAAGPRAVWVTWSIDDTFVEAAGARVTSSGEVGPFGPVQRMPRSHRCRFGDIAIGPSGVVAIVCERDIQRTRPIRAELRVAIDADGLGPARFGDPVVAATTKVSTFEPIAPQRRRTVDAEAGLGWIMAGADRGRLVLLFTDERPDRSDDTNVVVKVSDDRAGTWSSRVVVTAAANAQFLPRLAVDPATGHLAAGWHDASLDDGSGIHDTDGVANTDAMYAMSFSADGLTWSAPQMISAAASNARASGNAIEFGDYTGLAFAGGVAHPAWADNSNSTGDNPDGTLDAFDVYSAAVPEF
jgi:hypothetical protein